MAVKPGYKQTVAGVIPNDWRPSTIGDEADLLTGFPFPSNGFNLAGTRLLRGSNVKRGELDWTNDITEYWPSITPDIQRYALRDGDVVIAMDGALVGRSYAVVAEEDLPALLVQRVARIRSTNTDLRLLAAWIGSKAFGRHVDAVKTHSAIPHISPRDIREFALPLPTDGREQRAIAAALTDVDDLVASLDRLIAKKRAIKQGVMHDLLTGRKRLPGFSGEWREALIGELADIDPEALPQATDPMYEFNYVALEDVTRGTLRSFQRLRFAIAPSRARRILRYHDILIGTVRPNLQSHLLHVCRESSWVCSTGFTVVRCDPSRAYPDFVFHSFFGIDLNKQIATLIAGSNYPAISSRDVAALTIPTPPLPEQRAIADVLTDLDDEIDALQARRDKTSAMKQAMMAELLTGRTRLV